MREYRYPLVVLSLVLAMLACNLPESWIDVGYDLPTVTPSITPSPSATLYVAKTGNDAHDCVTPASACLTIMAAVGKAPVGALINVGAGTYLELGPQADEGMILRDKNLWVRGAGPATAPTTVISGGAGRDALTVIGSSRVVVENVVVTGGGTSAGGNGYGLYVTGGANATLRNSLVQANAQAGVRTLGNISLVLEGVSVSGNSSGGISNPLGNLIVRRSRIVNNLGQPAVYTGGHVEISDTTIAGNHSAIPGAAIFNEAGGVLLLQRSTVSGNTVTGTEPDFAIYNYSGAQMTVVNSTISGNAGTGIQTFGSLAVVFSTIVRNGSAGIFANTVSASGLHLHLENSIIEENTALDCSYQTGAAITFDLSGQILSDGSCNVISPGPFSPGTRRVDRFLGPLANNGGPTQTHALLPGSAAIDAAGDACVSTDQRGDGRPVGGGCDVGAFEYSFALSAATAEPSETPTPFQLFSDTPAPTATVLASATPDLLVLLAQNANCRKGPGTGYDAMTSFAAGMNLLALARNDQSSWLQVAIPTGGACWLAVSTLTKPGLPDGLAILQAPPLPDAPGAFSDKATCVVKLKKLSVKLSWSGSSNAMGYHIYRNGTLLDTLPANATLYIDGSAPLSKDLLYELEAYNANGTSPRVQTTVSACK